jgi:hypothetical protein
VRARWRDRQTAASTSPVATAVRAGASDPTIVPTGTTAAAASSSTVNRRLVVHAKDRRDQTVSSWHVPYAGAMRLSATTTIATAGIERLDVVDDDSGHLLLAVNADSVQKKSR